MVRIRLKRLGRKKSPFYRVVVTDMRNKRDGAPITELGYYNPMLRQLKLDKVAALDWIKKGAVPSESVQRLIDKATETGELIQLEKAHEKRRQKKAEKQQNALKAAAEAAEAEKAQKEAEKAARLAEQNKEQEAAATAAAEAPAPEAAAEEAPAETPVEA